VAELAHPSRRGVSILVCSPDTASARRSPGAVAAGFAEFGGWRAAMVAVGAVSFVAAGGAWLWLRDPLPRVEAAERPAGEPAALQILRPTYLLGTLMLWLLFVLMLTISYCLNSWLPIMLVEAGFDESFAALSITIFGVGGAIAALGVGLLVDRFGAMPVLIGFLGAAATTLLAAGQVMTPLREGYLRSCSARQASSASAPMAASTSSWPPSTQTPCGQPGSAGPRASAAWER
jgi:predicted MFS family arabinose efflux permease